MNPKKIISTTSKIIWLIIGAAILLWTVFWYYQIHIIGNLGGIFVGAILLGIGIYALMFFMLITGLFIITKWLIKKRK
jgi:hypothetical protein